MFYIIWKTLLYVVVHLSPGEKASEDHWASHLSSVWSIAVVRRWSNATGGSFSLFPRSSSSIVHQPCPKAISAPTLPNIIHTTRPLFEDGKGFWGGWRGRGGYQSIADNHSVWPQPCNAWPTSNVYIFSVFFLFATLVNCPCFVADFSTISATLSYVSALHATEIWQKHFNDFSTERKKILFWVTFYILWNYITQIIYDTVVHIANVLWLGNAEKRSVRIQRQQFVWMLLYQNDQSVFVS